MNDDNWIFKKKCNSLIFRTIVNLVLACVHPTMTSSTVAYILWFFLGFLGVHHFYLHRDRHAFVIWATFGGLFGLGWLRDLFHLSSYVDECKEDEEASGYVNDTMHEYEHAPQRSRAKPHVSMARFAGMVLMGMNFGYLVTVACPPEWLERKDIIGFAIRYVVPMLASAAGVHLVANIGRHRATKKWPLIGALIGGVWLAINPSNLSMVSLISALATWWFGVTIEPHPKPRKGFCTRVSKLALCGTIYLLLWGSSIYYNAKVISKDGEEVPVRVAVNNFFKSPAWMETKESFNHLWEHVKAHGWSKLFEEIINAIDPEGEANAYKVLGLDVSATQEEIKTQYRKLAREWHPDKQIDPEKKEEAQAKFVEIQQAYEILSAIKAKRMKKNKQQAQTEPNPKHRHTEF